MSSSNTRGHERRNDERTPLLGRSPSKATLSSSSDTNPARASPDATNPSAIYAKVLESALPWYRRPSPIWLLPVYVAVATTAGMLLSSLVTFQVSMLCREFYNRNPPTTNFYADYTSYTAFDKDPRCKLPDVQAYAAKILGLIEVLAAVASTLTVGYYTSMSDRHGRVKFIGFAFFNTVLMLLAIVTMNAYWDQIGLPLLFASGILNGALGGVGLGLTLFLAYSADCTDPSKRSLMYSWVHAALFLGLTVGPSVGGIITNATNTVLTIVYIDLGVNVVALIFLFLVVPESLPHLQSPTVRKLFREAKRKARLEAGLEAEDDNDNEQMAEDEKHERAAWHTHAVRSLRFFKPNGRNTNIILLAAISCLQTLIVKGTLSVIVLYTQRMFNWDSLEVGFLFSLGNGGRLLSLIVVLPVLVYLFQKQNKWKLARQERQKQNKQKPARHDHQEQSRANKPMPTTSDTLSSLNQIENDIMAASSVEQLGEAILEHHTDAHDRTPATYTQPSDTSRAHDRPPLTAADSTASWSSSKTKTPASDDVANATGSSSPTAANGNGGAGADRAKQSDFSGIKFDTWMIRLGFAINSLTYFQLGLAQTGWQFYVGAGLHSFAILSTPPLKSLLTMMVEPSQYGAILGALQVVDALASIFSPVVISWVYALTVYSFPQFIWYICGVVTGICFILSFFIRQKEFRERTAA
ncbi:hypothetical protein BGZ73_007501 [Actinomortierella ambigua]|nr:hypothetical protein BGZ73_007501 [Actinomortierella ambigua]